MQILSLSLNDFGAWKNLSMGNLSGSLNVLHGPNEAGKTTGTISEDEVIPVLVGLGD